MQLVFSIARERLASAPLLILSDLIQWPEVEQHMQADYWQATFRKGGRTPYDYRAMFRALLIARWYGITFPALESAMRVRLDFLLFCGFNGNAKLPEASTLSRFRARLTNNDTLPAMFAEVDRQLKAQDVDVIFAKGALLDVLVVQKKAKFDSSVNTPGATLGATEN